MVGQSQPMQRVLESIRTVAPNDTTVLIHGESGTGKELVARAIHNLSPRRFMPMVTIHCGALTETLLESELFGHEKGAFTGAQYRKKGKFEVAEGGTVFLDEISDISLKTQTDLLRVLQEKEITRVGGNQTIKVDFRAVAATNKDLPTLVKEGTFRPDLYYRLDVFGITLPPLRERKEDIPLLVDHFLQEVFARHEQALHRHQPRGARRPDELPVARQRARVGERHRARHGDRARAGNSGLGFPLPGVGAARMPEGSMALEDVERGHIQRVLEACDWNQTRAAKALGIDRVTLYNKIKKYGFRKDVPAGS